MRLEELRAKINSGKGLNGEEHEEWLKLEAEAKPEVKPEPKKKK